MTTDVYTRPRALAVALLGNADDLLDEAELLLANDRPVRALALSICAAEELAKIEFCLDALTLGDPIPASNSRQWRDHKDKILSTLALDVAFVHESPAAAVGHLRSEADALAQARMACLYVDHSGEDIRSPKDVTSDAGSLVKRLRANSRLLHSVLDRATPEVFAVLAPHMANLAAAFDACVDENDYLATLELLRSVVLASVGDARELVVRDT